MSSDESTIEPLIFDRGACTPQANPEALVLKDVDNRESVYSRVLGLLEGAGLPSGYDVEQISHPWDL